MYCPRPRCSQFINLNSLEVPRLFFPCPGCSNWLCADCHTEAHVGVDCATNKANSTTSDDLMRSLAEKEGWKLCGNCSHILSKDQRVVTTWFADVAMIFARYNSAAKTGGVMIAVTGSKLTWIELRRRQCKPSSDNSNGSSGPESENCGMPVLSRGCATTSAVTTTGSGSPQMRSTIAGTARTACQCTECTAAGVIAPCAIRVPIFEWTDNPPSSPIPHPSRCFPRALALRYRYQWQLDICTHLLYVNYSPNRLPTIKSKPPSGL